MMEPWNPTFAFALDNNEDAAVDAAGAPPPGPGRAASAAANAKPSCCSGGSSGGSAAAMAAAEKNGARDRDQELLAQALFHGHPELGVSGIKVDHRQHRVEVLAAPASSQARRGRGSHPRLHQSRLPQSGNHP